MVFQDEQVFLFIQEDNIFLQRILQLLTMRLSLILHDHDNEPTSNLIIAWDGE